MRIRLLLAGLTVFIFLMVSCNSPYTSRKKGYFHIPLPVHTYQTFDKAGFPYSFEYPAYAQIVQDSTYFDSTPENPYWINIDFPQYDARIFLSYKIIGGKAIYKVKQVNGIYKDSAGVNYFDKMINDAFSLTSKNEPVASSIKDSLMETPNNIHGVYFKVGGNAATAHQFFLTDTLTHFLRGALYFNATPNSDSIKPVQDFLTEDIKHLINSFRWRP